ncbi:serine aminopeptidase domain-containing protein [Caldimonas brevitalea]|uniref:Serine aminopeptidase S33 domain-containing protein n=1 Tax=Caldimonas brevitalea TaxID=413882 RepID=A0A0G3BTN0_9BURK|nr:alpha/beta hydrolase [Caldimonas brevitalea]AKJ29875.1 hypothetical protein AAW51_3184 [Caldimonas brevitalea]
MKEETLVFGPERNLVGTFTHPAADVPARDDLMVLLSNAGVIPRIGPHRINVKLARQFASLGLPTLRFDTNGLGDSARSSSTLPVAEQFVADTRSAMDAAEARFGRRHFLMVGMCSGADIAHLTALEDVRLKGIVMFDSYVYPTRKTAWLRRWHLLRNAGVLGAVGKVLVRALRLLWPRRAGSSAAGAPRPSAAVGIFGRSSVPSRDEFAERLKRLVERQVQLHFIFSGGEPGAYNYHRQFHDTFGRYGLVDRVGYEFLRECDHVLTLPQAQDLFIRTVMQWLRNKILIESQNWSS